MKGLAGLVLSASVGLSAATTDGQDQEAIDFLQSLPTVQQIVEQTGSNQGIADIRVYGSTRPDHVFVHVMDHHVHGSLTEEQTEDVEEVNRNIAKIYGYFQPQIIQIEGYPDWRIPAAVNAAQYLGNKTNLDQEAALQHVIIDQKYECGMRILLHEIGARQLDDKTRRGISVVFNNPDALLLLPSEELEDMHNRFNEKLQAMGDSLGWLTYAATNKVRLIAGEDSSEYVRTQTLSYRPPHEFPELSENQIIFFKLDARENNALQIAFADGDSVVFSHYGGRHIFGELPEDIGYRGSLQNNAKLYEQRTGKSVAVVEIEPIGWSTAIDDAVRTARAKKR